MACLPMSAPQRSRRMKRWASTILLFLLLVSGGAIVNIAVAWGLALVPRSRVMTGLAPVCYLVEEPDWSVYSRYKPGACHIQGHVSTLISGWDENPPRWSITATRPSNQDDRHRLQIHEYARGWPMLSQYYRWSSTGGRAYVLDWGWRVSWLTKRQAPDDGGAVPLAVIWPGFLVNTVFYAAILWPFTCGPFVLRRLIRRKRGRCPKCGYDLRGQPPEVGAAGCPECGWNRASEHAPGEDAV